MPCDRFDWTELSVIIIFLFLVDSDDSPERRSQRSKIGIDKNIAESPGPNTSSGIFCKTSLRSSYDMVIYALYFYISIFGRRYNCIEGRQEWTSFETSSCWQYCIPRVILYYVEATGANSVLSKMLFWHKVTKYFPELHSPTFSITLWNAHLWDKEYSYVVLRISYTLKSKSTVVS